MNYYVRFGLWPEDERSRVGEMLRRSRGWMLGELPEFEEGVSVYAAEWDSAKNRWAISSDGLSSYLPTLDELIAQGRDVYLVTGDEQDDCGTDGEPLLKNVQLVKKLTYKDIYNAECYAEDAILADEPFPAISNQVQFLLKRPGHPAEIKTDVLGTETIQQHLGGYYQMFHVFPGGIVALVLELDYPEQNTQVNVFWPQLGGPIFGPMIITALASVEEMVSQRKKLPWPWYKEIDSDPEVEWVEGIPIPGEEFKTLREQEIASIVAFLNKAGAITC